MKKRHDRRAVSITPQAYERLREYCEGTGQAMSAVIEDYVHRLADSAGIEQLSRDEAIARRMSRGAPTHVRSHEFPGQHFTF